MNYETLISRTLFFIDSLLLIVVRWASWMKFHYGIFTPYFTFFRRSSSLYKSRAGLFFLIQIFTCIHCKLEDHLQHSHTRTCILAWTEPVSHTLSVSHHVIGHMVESKIEEVKFLMSFYRSSSKSHIKCFRCWHTKGRKYQLKLPSKQDPGSFVGTLSKVGGFRWGWINVTQLIVIR